MRHLDDEDGSVQLLSKANGVGDNKFRFHIATADLFLQPRYTDGYTVPHDTERLA
jgi:hypothetical protein